MKAEISDFILLGGLLDPENSQKVLAKGHEKMNLLRETPNVNLAVLKSSVLSLTDNQHRESNSIVYGQYDIPIWAVKHLSEGKDSSLSEAKLSEIESFKSQSSIIIRFLNLRSLMFLIQRSLLLVQQQMSSKLISMFLVTNTRKKVFRLIKV